MTRLLVILIFGSMFAASSAAAQEIYNGLWVVNSESLSCNAACHDRYRCRQAGTRRASNSPYAQLGLRATRLDCGQGTMPGQSQHLQDPRRRRH